MDTKVSIIIPTRGWVHAACMTSVLDNIRTAEVNTHLVIQTGLPIPDCFNVPVEEEMATFNPDYYWFVEEDVEPPFRALQALLRSQYDVTAIDYPLSTGYGCVGWYRGRPMWCGTGCTLVNARVFDMVHGVPRPWFRSDVAYEEGEDNYFRREGIKNTYGGHDIHFGIMVNKSGLSMGVIPNMTARHWKLKKSGEGATNTGTHEFVVYDHIAHANVLPFNPLDAIDR